MRKHTWILILSFPKTKVNKVTEKRIKMWWEVVKGEEPAQDEQDMSR